MADGDDSKVLKRAEQFGFDCGSSSIPWDENPYAEESGEMFAAEDAGRLRAALIEAWFAGWDRGVAFARLLTAAKPIA